MRRQAIPWAVAAWLALMTGCNEYDLSGTEHTEVWILGPSVLVDILFVVDNSPSMVQEHQKVKDGFASFIFEVNESQSDWQIGVTTTDMETNAGGVLLGPDPLFISPATDNYKALFLAKINTVGTNGSGWEKGLQAARRALFDSPAGVGDTANAGFLRDEADLAIVVVSDENDCSDEGALPHVDQEECYTSNDLLEPLTSYIQAFEGLKGEEQDVTFSAIVGPPIVDGCEDTKPGHRYLSMASELDGLKASICEADYAGIMSDLGLTATGVQTFFALQWTPDEESIEVTVDEAEVPTDPTEQNGWSYRPEENTVHLWGAHTPPRGSTVRIHYWTALEE